MKGIKKFFSGLLVVILISIIIGGVGFIGYKVFKGGSMDMQMGTTTSDQNTQDSTDAMDGMATDTMNNDNKNTQSQQNSTSLNQINIIMQNKDLLDKTSLLLNDAMKLMTLDPYAMSQKNGTMQNNNTIPKEEVKDNTATTPADNNTNPQGNTTVNIYPSNGTVSTNSTSDNVMQSMGAAYDQGKMEQVHAGLYKLSIGMQLLDQLKDNLTTQVEQAGANVDNLSQYYTNQYYITLDNKNKLTSILSYLSESAELININPYISTSGAVYDKDRMLQLHQSITKRAEGIVGLNKLSDNFSKQLILFSNMAQNSTSMSGMDMNSTNMFSGLLTNINLGTIASIVLVIFVVIFIIGLLGFIKSLFKPTNVPNNNK
jgi:hypothetical protein